MSRRGATALAGVLLIDKPAGMTSHDVVVAVRRATGEGRVGHAGTLDPAATGLLVVLIGPYTRLAPYMAGADKAYSATIVFGRTTGTDDAEGVTTDVADVPDNVLDPEYAQGLLDSYLGASSQVPPAYSAIKVDGRTAHRAARAGAPLDLAPREIHVSTAQLVRILSGPPPAWQVEFAVSKGTYVRALARDIGRAAGTLAHLGALTRTTSGALTVANAHTLDDIQDAARRGQLETLFTDPVAALGLPALPAGADDLAAGRRIPVPDGAPASGGLVSLLVDGKLAAIYRRDADTLVPEVVLVRGEAA